MIFDGYTKMKIIFNVAMDLIVLLSDVTCFLQQYLPINTMTIMIECMKQQIVSSS